MDKTPSFTRENTSGADHSASIDLTMDDYEGDSATASSMESHYGRMALKRRLSISLTESMMDPEEDGLHSARTRPSWSFGRISKPNIFPRQKPVPPSLSHGDILTIQSSHKRLRNEFASSNKQAVTGASIRNLGVSRASSLHQADTEDVQMLDGKPSNFNSPAQMLRANSISITPRRSSTHNLSAGNRMPLTSGTGTSEDEWGGIEIDRLYPLRRSGSERGRTTIPPGTEVIDLEEATGNAIQDDRRFDRFESDYLTDAEYEIFLRSERRNSGQDSDSEVIEVDDAKLIANLKRINLQGRAGSTASKIFPLPQVQHRNRTYKAGKCVELNDGSFLRIKSIHKDTSGEILLVGDLLLRTNFQGPRMPKRRNELVWVIMTNDLTDDSKSSTTMNLNSVKCIRKVRFTNQRYEKLNTTKHENALKNKYDDVNFGESFCRIRRTQIISDNGRKVIEESIELIEESEADAGDRIDASKLRDDWRGVRTILGGSSSQTYQLITLDEGVSGGADSIRVQKHTYGEAFCGAGGSSRGAVMAGLKVKWAFDCDRDAVVTYRANYDSAGTQCYEETVAEFLDRISRLPIHQQQEFMVDILHISPPCQPFSPAHTIENVEKDAKNRAALCSVLHLIQVIKPRVVTIEETEGLLSRHDEWFSTLIHIFVYVGYSVRWKALRCEEYGVPQMRRRLFLIASAPGEKPPQIAKPTHGVGGADLVTIRDSISNIPRAATAQKQLPTTRGVWPKPSYSARTLCRTLTCGGGPPHPSGRRNFTLRELASLQTFPWFHLFPVSGITIGRRQVGNAVPPLMAKTLYEEIIRTLQETDGVRGRN
jgi:DNA (cytosine-5)-methyltransferase 1